MLKFLDLTRSNTPIQGLIGFLVLMCGAEYLLVLAGVYLVVKLNSREPVDQQ